MTPKKTILLVGYGWFSSIPEGETNNSELIARALDGETIEATARDGAPVHGVVHSLIVPVVWDDAFPPVREEIERIKPDVVLAMGTDARIAGLRPEPYGVNWQRGADAKPDNPDAQTTMDGKILPDGEDYLRGTLPYEAMVMECLKAGVPALLGQLLPAQEDVPLSVSATPGLYLCNKMTYLLADYGQKTGVPAGFLHVPTQPEYAAARRLTRILELPEDERPAAMTRLISAMPLPMMIEGVRACLRACLAAL